MTAKAVKKNENWAVLAAMAASISFFVKTIASFLIRDRLSAPDHLRPRLGSVAHGPPIRWQSDARVLASQRQIRSCARGWNESNRNCPLPQSPNSAFGS